MSLGPHRTPYGFSAMSSTPNSLPRQHVMNAPTFQQVMTIVPASNPPTLPTHHNNNNSNNNNNNNSNNNNNNNNGAATNNASITRHVTAGATPQNLYCDNCQTFRHVAFFQEKEYKYKVCKMCSERELQKRIYNKERYEQYEEQQKNLKHNRYSIQQQQQRQQQAYSAQTATSVYAQQAQVPPHYANSNNTAANPTPAPSTSSQIPMQLPQMPIGLGGGNASANLPPPPNLATPTNSNNASPQISTPSSSSMMLGINMKGNNSSNKQHTFQTVAILPNSNNTNTTTNNNNNNNVRHDQQQLHMHQVIQPSLPLPNPSIATQRNRASNRAASNASIATNVNLISLDEFVEELKRHIDFDRKLYHIDIQSLIESMGPSAGFTQLGRKICEKVLEGTKFNFSLKDRRRSTKSPDTLSTLRYYCSQRIDTAKPRKAGHPKAQLKYDCAGALTIIIDLLKKSAHVTVIHKHAHPPFVSHHHQIKHQQQQKRQIQPLQQQQQQQQKHQQQDDQQQRLLKLTKQKQHQISKQFEQLKQTVNEIGLLLDSQTPYANEDFLKVATEALSEANEMVRACKAVEENLDVIYPPNKYTLHYKKRGDYGNLF